MFVLGCVPSRIRSILNKLNQECICPCPCPRPTWAVTLSSSRQLASEICCTLKSSLPTRRPKLCKGNIFLRLLLFGDILPCEMGREFSRIFPRFALYPAYGGAPRPIPRTRVDTVHYIMQRSMDICEWTTYPDRMSFFSASLIVGSINVRKMLNYSPLLLPGTLSASSCCTTPTQTSWMVAVRPHYIWLRGRATSRFVDFCWSPRTRRWAMPM